MYIIKILNDHYSTQSHYIVYLKRKINVSQINYKKPEQLNILNTKL